MALVTASEIAVLISELSSTVHSSRAEKAAALAAKSEELKAFVERMRAALHMKVSLIGNDHKGRIYIDYFSAEELYRFMHVLDVIESEDFD